MTREGERLRRPTYALPLDLCASQGVESVVLVPRSIGGQMADEPQDVLDTGWVERSHRVAAALIAAESPLTTITAGDYDKLEGLVAQAWRHGHLDGMERAEEIMGGEQS